MFGQYIYYIFSYLFSLYTKFTIVYAEILLLHVTVTTRSITCLVGNSYKTIHLQIATRGSTLNIWKRVEKMAGQI